MALTEDQKLISNFYESIGSKISGHLIDINQGIMYDNFIFTPSDDTTVSKMKSVVKAAKAKGIKIICTSAENHRFAIFQFPKEKHSKVAFEDLITDSKYKKSKDILPIILGVTSVYGYTSIYDLQKFPHLLIAGQKATGKTTLIKSILKSLSNKYKPDECKFIIMNSKVKEFTSTEHFLLPTINKTDVAIETFKTILQLIEERNKTLKNNKVKTILEYKEKTHKKDMPFIIIAIDEIADLMKKHKKETETFVETVCSKAKAVGIHLIISTQHTTPNIITKQLKVYCPTRIAFNTPTQKDSIAILGESGAEALFRYGDILLSESGTDLFHIHTALVK